jgi:hypothetical protein
MASQFVNAWRVCAWMLSPAMRPVLGSIPVVPEMKTWDPALTPWLKRGELGAFDVVMI